MSKLDQTGKAGTEETLAVIPADDAPGAATGSAGATANAGGLSGQLALSAATEDVALPGTTKVATFSDTNMADVASSFTATIDWGDGTTTAGTVTGSSGAFSVSGGHTYADEESAPVSVILTRIADKAMATASGTVAVGEDDGLSGSVTAIAPTAGVAFSGKVATFSDTDLLTVANDLIATINWGDGTTTAGTVSGSNGAFTVSGGHTYASLGTDTMTVTLTDDAPGTATAAASGTVNVDGLSGQLALGAATEDVALANGTKVATFADTNTADLASAFTATIDWGDGTTTAGTVAGSSGSFSVSGGHTYADEESAPVSVILTRIADKAMATASGTVAVGEHDSLLGAATAIAPTAGVAFSGKVATFSDTDLVTLASDLVATINWGDGTTTTGTVASSNGAFTVSGGHTYASLGTDTMTVTLADDAPGTATASASATFNVGGLSGQLALSAATEDVALAGTTKVATFTDTNNADVASGFTATIDWGDGTTTAGTVAGSNGAFSVSGGHTYADEESAPVSVILTRTADKATATASGTVAVGEDDSLLGSVTAIAPAAGVGFSGEVATFSDTNLTAAASDLIAVIDWGDGTTTAGTVVGSNGAFTVLGGHTYASPGTDTMTVTLTDDAPGTATAAATGTVNVIPCFCRGTRILTEVGEVPVEELAIGDRVVTVSGVAKPIRWIGMGRNLVTRSNRLARPVIVRRGALADNVPTRDLYLTHGHALYLDGALIPVENLVNHRSILWDERAQVVEYYHIELADHDLLLAEGAPAESYYDANNRALFQNARPGSEAGTARPTFAPVLNGGGIVDRVWAELFERAGGKFNVDTTDDPDLHLVVDGERLDAATAAGGRYTFVLDAPLGGALHVCSHSGVPSLLGVTVHDHRRLGVAIKQIVLCQARVATNFACEASLFLDGGCHPAETGYCWTDGDLCLPPRLFAHLTGAFTLTVHTERPGMRYTIESMTAMVA